MDLEGDGNRATFILSVFFYVMLVHTSALNNFHFRCLLSSFKVLPFPLILCFQQSSRCLSMVTPERESLTRKAQESLPYNLSWCCGMLSIGTLTSSSVRGSMSEYGSCPESL